MRSRSLRSIAVLLTVLLLANSPVQAGPVAIGEIMQVLGNFQNPPDLRISQGPATSQKSTTSPPTNQPGNTSVVVSHADSVLSGVVVETNTQDPVNITIEGDIEGTVCDCGELLALGGGFPKWPLLFLAGVPFFFLDKDKDDECITCEQVTPTPTPTPTPQTPVPEPASLLLLGSGLAAFGAGLRKRRMKAKLERETTEEG